MDDKRLRRHKRWRNEAKSSPWRDWWEFEAVGNALLKAANYFGDANNEWSDARRCLQDHGNIGNSMSLEEALQRVAVWRNRSHGKLPHSVDSTASLAQVIWRDSQSMGLNSLELRLAYSCAILRSINGLADTLQQDRATAASVALLCQQMGIPSWLVDIRHESTHNQLPTLPILRMATKTMLEYYSNVYWNPLIESRQKCLSEIKDMLLAYHAAALVAVSSTLVETVPDTDEAYIMSAVSSDAEGTDPDPPKNVGPLETRIIGTSYNRFAALQEEIKRERSPAKKAKLLTPPKYTSGAKAANPSLSVFAKDLVRSNFSPLLLYPALLDFFIWRGAVDQADAGGTLVPSPSQESSTSNHEKDFDLILKRYSILILTIIREWPGFLSTLLVHLVEFVLLVDESTESDQDRLDHDYRLSLAISWIRHILSRSFLVHFDASLRKAKSTERVGSDHLPLEKLQALHLPIHSLLDRCRRVVRSNDSKANHESLNELLVVFSNITGISDEESLRDELDGDNVERDPTPLRTEIAKSLTLDEMEAFLNSDFKLPLCTNSTSSVAVNRVGAKGYGKQPLPSSTSQRNAWDLCSSWDPSVLGTLPGFAT